MEISRIHTGGAVMILYVAVARCPKCGRPVLGYLREEKRLTDQRKRVMAVTLSCLNKDCAWLDVVEGAKTLKIFDMPWEEQK